MRKPPRKLTLHRETVRVLNDRLMTAAGGRVPDATGDTCLCAPTYWETCQKEIAVG